MPTNMIKARPTSRPGQTKRAPKSRGILVLGMHRSGTSACTRVLNLLGCALPDDLLPPGHGNEVEQWESTAVVSLNEEMLASAGSRWDDWGPINDDWRQSDVRIAMVERARSVAAEHAKLGPLFAIKDPRLCRLADVWLSALQEEQIEPLVVLMLRNPAEVAQSLESRDLMSHAYGRLLWLRHVLDAEMLSRGQRRVACRYDQLLTNWYGVIDRIKSGLGVALPRNAPAVHAEIDAFLTPQHRHHDNPADLVTNNFSLSEWLQRTYAIMLAWSENGEDVADHAELDSIRAEFDRSYGAFARLLMQSDAAGEVGSGSSLKRQLVAQLAETQQLASTAQATIQDAQARLAAQTAREAELAAQLQAGAERAQSMQTEVERLKAERQHLAGLEAELVAVRSREANLMAETTRLNASLATAGGNVQSLQANVARLEIELHRLAGLEAEYVTFQSREASLVAEIAQLNDSLVNAGGNVENLQAEVARLEAERQRLAELETEFVSVQSREVSLVAEITRINALLVTAGGRVESLQAEVVQLETERQRLVGLEAELVDMAKEKERRVDAETRLESAIEDLKAQELQNAEMAGQLIVAKSTMAQREEELKQVWNQLLESQKLASVADTNASQERERRESADRRVADTDRELAELRSELEEVRRTQATASENVAAELQNALSLGAQDARDAAEQEIVRYKREVEDLAGQFRRLEEEAHAEQSARIAAEQRATQQRREIDLLSNKLRQQEPLLQAAESARIAAERKLASRFDEIARLTTMLTETAGRSMDSDTNTAWLRELLRVSQGFPKWWALMPKQWRQKKEHARYLRKNVFDAEQYLANNPDVAQFGIDPVLHYILHGMEEGRTWRR